jgi:nucleotide-binding universal stress UspA family protein
LEAKLIILVGYNGSDASKKALGLAKQHAGIWQGRIEVVQAVARKEPLSYHKIQDVERQLAHQVKNIINGQQARVETTLLVGIRKAGEQIINFAQTIHADEIIIGSQKRSRIGKLFLGSTTQFVVLNASCPVIVVK